LLSRPNTPCLPIVPVFILDESIHHGSGIQDIAYDDPNIFYISIHRAFFGINQNKHWFSPGTGRHTEVGTGAGTGSNLNIV
jgi:acetoin utilization deacetylase AcuC-like enzyme